ncbi:hypothetical protein KDL01_38315 [Actinospica durhamensis]|uniref:Uncharacterized protein n=1 Tax=Actinospica durhamensis TaxID=1508375 RepID=A0A941EVR7_9ACTN|nr:hypothetical protein [Actinospica durhamensis]MBR7839180.1 hypothetical protein [Actinospica durhamensis]
MGGQAAPDSGKIRSITSAPWRMTGRIWWRQGSAWGEDWRGGETFQAEASYAAASPVGFCFVMAMFGLLAGRMCWLAVRQWRDPGQFGRGTAFMSSGLGPTAADGLVRGFVVYAAQFVCLLLMCACVGLGDPSRQDGGFRWVAVALLVCFTAGFPLLVAITWFNQPRFLVVPYLRHLDRAALRERRQTLRGRRPGVHL